MHFSSNFSSAQPAPVLYNADLQYNHSLHRQNVQHISCRVILFDSIFKKAFNSIQRDKLWQVLKSVGVKGKLFSVVKDMYRFVKACVRVNDEYTDYFNCPVGLKEECLLSPMIFSIFITDLAEHVQNSSSRGIQLLPDLVEVFLLLFCRRYCFDLRPDRRFTKTVRYSIAFP